jgi:periplasmic protein TonB
MSRVYGQTGGWRALGGVVALHGVVLLALLSMKPVAEAVGLSQPLMVSLLTPAAPEPEIQPEPLPPRPQVRPEPVTPPPVLVAREDAPTPIVAPAPSPEPVPEPVPVVLPAPTPEPAKQVAAAPVVVQAPPAPILPPRFDADYLDNPAPSYPPLSRRLREHGRVLLRVYVSPEGGATRVEIRESSGYDRLDKAAQDTVQRWRFVPARQGDKGVAAWVLVPISFSLRS